MVALALDAAVDAAFGFVRCWVSPSWITDATVVFLSGLDQGDAARGDRHNRVMTLAHRLEYATQADPSLNYCLWPYPPAAAAEDKFRSVNLLYQSFDFAGLDPRVYEMVDAIRERIGPFRTVFGVKRAGDDIAWEYYFYDYKRRDRQVSISIVLQAIRDFMPCAIQANENLPYFMFSLDLNAAALAGPGGLDVVHMYVGNPGSSLSSGIAYGLRTGGATLENFYFFFDAGTQMADVAGKIASSALFDDTVVPVTAVLRPELRDCRTICVANKQAHDCIYFSGIAIDQFIWFLDWQHYPAAIANFVRENRTNLDHLRFDVGIDYRFEGGALRILKSGYYGVF